MLVLALTLHQVAVNAAIGDQPTLIKVLLGAITVLLTMVSGALGIIGRMVWARLARMDGKLDALPETIQTHANANTTAITAAQLDIAVVQTRVTALEERFPERREQDR